MNLDDESLLSAYLDDELDPADRLAVEWSVESSPPLADQLRSLATARDAVASLGRPTLPGDLGPAILARLAADRRRARLHALARPGRVAMAVAGLSAMAASLLFALLQLHRSMQPDSEPLPATASHIRTHPIPQADPAPAPAIVSTPPALKSPEAAAPAAPPLVASAEEARDRADRRRIGAMLERPDVRVVLITTDVIDAPGQIRDLISKDAREAPQFGRITIQTGIVVDPNRPGSAEVFVVSLNEGERSSFIERLRDHFKDLEEDERPSPDLVTQLSEVGHVAIFEGTRASTLVDPPAPLPPVVQAVKTADPNGERLPAQAEDRGLAADPPGSTDPGRVHPDPFVGPPRPSSPTDPVTLLVWVTRPGKH